MVSRRVRAVVEFVVSLLALVFTRFLRRRTDDESAPPSSSWLSVGVASSVVYLWCYDRDSGGIRQNRVRSAIVAAAWTVASNRRVLGSEAAAQNFSNGALVGTVAYRFRYGLLRPVPGPDGERERS